MSSRSFSHKEYHITKIAITSDLHFGVAGRLTDILWSARTIREHCKTHQIDTVLVLGDLFHDRRMIEINVLSEVSKFFEETNEKYRQQWVVFPGNHDMYLRHSWNITSLVTLRKHLTVIEEIKLLKIDNARFWVVPFITYESPYLKVIKKIENHYEDNDVLLTHIGVRGATLNTCFLLKDWSIVTFAYSKFKRVYTGHFHSRQQVGDNVWYPGSPIPFKFDEGDVPHGFYVYDTDKQEHIFVDIWEAGNNHFPEEQAPPQYYTIPDDRIESLTAKDVENGLVRIALQKDYTIDEKRQIKNHIERLGARSVRWMDLTQKIKKQELISAAPSRNLFESWLEIDNKSIRNLDIKILKKINDEIIHEGDEKYSIEEAD